MIGLDENRGGIQTGQMDKLSCLTSGNRVEREYFRV